MAGNTALAVAPEADYAFVKINIENGSEQLVLAEAVLNNVLTDQYEVLGTCRGKELVGERLRGKGVEYEPLYRLPQGFYQKFGGTVEVDGITPYVAGMLVNGALAGDENFWLIAENFVSLNEGTGIVHVAPAFGTLYDSYANVLSYGKSVVSQRALFCPTCG